MASSSSSPVSPRSPASLEEVIRLAVLDRFGRADFAQVITRVLDANDCNTLALLLRMVEDEEYFQSFQETAKEVIDASHHKASIKLVLKKELRVLLQTIATLESKRMAAARPVSPLNDGQRLSVIKLANYVKAAQPVLDGGITSKVLNDKGQLKATLFHRDANGILRFICPFCEHNGSTPLVISGRQSYYNIKTHIEGDVPALAAALTVAELAAAPAAAAGAVAEPAAAGRKRRVAHYSQEGALHILPTAPPFYFFFILKRMRRG
jgi:hypothetical protein